MVAQDKRSLTCELPLGRAERIAARVILHEVFTPAPRAFVRFTVVTSGDDFSTVDVSGWAQNGRSQSQRVANLAGPKFNAPLLVFLSNLYGDRVVE